MRSIKQQVMVKGKMGQLGGTGEALDQQANFEQRFKWVNEFKNQNFLVIQIHKQPQIIKQQALFLFKLF